MSAWTSKAELHWSPQQQADIVQFAAIGSVNQTNMEWQLLEHTTPPTPTTTNTTTTTPTTAFY
jgi:hypothetical protein